jgi:hypothetical protein
MKTPFVKPHLIITWLLTRPSRPSGIHAPDATGAKLHCGSCTSYSLNADALPASYIQAMTESCCRKGMRRISVIVAGIPRIWKKSNEQE